MVEWRKCFLLRRLLLAKGTTCLAELLLFLFNSCLLLCCLPCEILLLIILVLSLKLQISRMNLGRLKHPLSITLLIMFSLLIERIEIFPRKTIWLLRFLHTLLLVLLVTVLQNFHLLERWKLAQLLRLMILRCLLLFLECSLP